MNQKYYTVSSLFPLKAHDTCEKCHTLTKISSKTDKNQKRKNRKSRIVHVITIINSLKTLDMSNCALFDDKIVICDP